VWIGGAKEKYGRCGWDHRPEFSIVGRDELETVTQHKAILVCIY
jgi:hypothetical protein